MPISALFKLYSTRKVDFGLINDFFQVHRATLKDGREVAVKVQHSYVRGNSLVDMKTMEVLVNMVAWFFPDFKFQWLVEESKKNLPQELDFLHEGKNAEKVNNLTGLTANIC